MTEPESTEPKNLVDETCKESLRRQEVFWLRADAEIYQRDVGYRWDQGGMLSLMAWVAHGFKGDKAFIFGTGPSVEALTDDLATEIAGAHFSLGVNSFLFKSLNKFPGLTPFPDACMLLDLLQGEILEIYKAAIKPYRAAGGRFIVTNSNPIPEYYDWQIPTYPMELDGNLSFGISDTAQRLWPDRKCINAAMHLTALLGFRHIYLLGVDFGDDYAYLSRNIKSRAELAALEGKIAPEKREEYKKIVNFFESETLAYHRSVRACMGALGEFMQKRGQQLYQCGDKAAWEHPSVKKISLEGALES